MSVFAGQLQAMAINERGQIVGSSKIHGNFGPSHAFFYDKGMMTDLGTLPGGLTSQATGIDNRSQVVGSADAAGGAQHAFLFDNGVMADLGTLPGGTFSQALATNNKGQVVGCADNASGA